MSTKWEKFKTGFISASTSIANATLEYDTPKIVHVKNKTVGVFNRLVQLAIIGYIVGYAIIYEKGYQKTEEVVSSVTTKVRGLGYTNGSGIYENAGDRVWDSSDYVVPAQSPNSVFIMTNMWVTNQTQGMCPDTSSDQCNATNPCDGRPNYTDNGVLNGSCSEPMADNKSYCWAKAWCPVERENKTISQGKPKLYQAVHFTILIKNTIQFPALDQQFRRRNLQDTKAQDLSCCRFNFDNNLFCPIFSLGAIIGMLENKSASFDDLAVSGAVLGLQIKWNCNLDRDRSKCKPRYSARRLDDPKAVQSPGLNFRFANTWIDSNGTLRRQLIKAYGIRINILVSGEGGKFDLSTLVIKLGSGIALLAIASVISDIVILYVLRERVYYRENKYVYVKGKATVFNRKLPFTIGNQKTDQLVSPARGEDRLAWSEGEDSQDHYNTFDHRI